ncbi:MAG TPA: phage tail sheath C-terminal domain-containing protein [Phenylobacterium sp.]
MPVMKTPGVYIVEQNAFPNSVVEVATAVPAFIGYTRRASNAGAPLTGRPFKITSMAEFERFFGGAPDPKFTITSLSAAPAAPGKSDNAAAIRAAKALEAADANAKTAGDAAAAAAARSAAAAIELKMAAKGLEVATDEAKAAKGSDKDTAAQVQKDAEAQLAAAQDAANAASAASKVAAGAKTAADAVLAAAKDANTIFNAPATPAAGDKDKTPAAAATTVTASTLKAAFAVRSADEETQYAVEVAGDRYRLYYAMRHFFENNGGPCYIVSVGDYEHGLDQQQLKDGIAALELEQEPTMVVIPDSVGLDAADKCIGVQQAMLAHCGITMRNRIAILDIYEGDQDLTDANDNPVSRFRDALGKNQLDFGAAYYPWVHTTIVQETDLSYLNFPGVDLGDIFLKDAGPAQDVLRAELKLKRADWETKAVGDTPEKKKAWVETSISEVDKALYQASAAYVTMLKAAARKLNLMPPAAAMAGLYTMVDNTRGVWKAPANISVNSVSAPAVNISHYQQESLNVHPQGKSINAIRSFIGEGVLVWGARTLDGNSLDWRYVNVRRTMIMLEESCKLAAKAMVFEPNVAGTWLTIKSMIQNFLTGIWKRGGLMGAVPEDAFSVHVGLGETMTPEDVLEGILRVTVLVAMVRPAEFIEITFQQLMPKS